ncbi:MAG: beta-N-acetylhexosaminidase [Deltaproteobacteria bacterium]|nr:beta-N-acetylhexosaminidase [Deltaproteobacteria bacterium]
MTRALAGQVLTVGIPGATLTRGVQRALARLAPGGVVLFARNAVDPPQLAALTAALHALPSRPLIGIDQEGGRVQRLPAPFTRFPSAAAIGRAGAGATRAAGVAIGRELRAAGIDIDYAPVLDVRTAGGDDVVGDRAFAADARRAATLAVAFLRGLRAAGVLACGKHFPGHGAADADSHLRLPTVRRGRAALARRELLPFRAAIAAGIPLLMAAHVRYPALDRRRCATLSPAIVTTLLRARLRFDGVVVSDDLAMGAIRNTLDAPRAAVAALRAGVDWLLLCGALGEAQRVADQLVATALADPRFAARLRQAAARVAALHSLRRPARAPLAFPVAAHLRLVERIRAVATNAAAC